MPQPLRHARRLACSRSQPWGTNSNRAKPSRNVCSLCVNPSRQKFVYRTVKVLSARIQTSCPEILNPINWYVPFFVSLETLNVALPVVSNATVKA